MNAQPARDPTVAPLLTESQLREMADFGSERSVEEGELLFKAGEATFDLFVVLEGEVEVMRPRTARSSSRSVRENFIGELGLLTGQRRFLDRPRDAAGTRVGDRAGRVPPA